MDAVEPEFCFPQFRRVTFSLVSVCVLSLLACGCSTSKESKGLFVDRGVHRPVSDAAPETSLKATGDSLSGDVVDLRPDAIKRRDVARKHSSNISVGITSSQTAPKLMPEASRIRPLSSASQRSNDQSKTVNDSLRTSRVDEGAIQLSSFIQEASQSLPVPSADTEKGSATAWDKALGEVTARFNERRQQDAQATDVEPFAGDDFPNLEPATVLPPPPASSQGNLYKYYDAPVSPAANGDDLQLRVNGDLLTLVSRGAPLGTIMSMIAQQHGLNIVAGESLDMPISVTLRDVPLQDAMDTILSAAGCTWVRQRNIIVISKISESSKLRPHVQGREVRVIQLNFVAAADVEKVVTGLLSPVGQIFVNESSATDKRRTNEQIVVEDLPEYLHRIENYVAQIDRPPRQVLIEAHILQIELRDENRHGVNFEALAQIAGADVTFSTRGFANPFASPAFFLDIDGTDLDALLEAIQTTTDSKTLASPKVLVLNGQDAKIQLGERIGFLVTTTTETSTLQNVDFLDVGVVLSVTPQITDDGQILMQVKPEVSRGGVNLETGLPDKETTEVDTTVMLPDGRGIVIGGLIQEFDNDSQSKIPILGDMWLVGRAFQRRVARRERSEVVIALIPRIVPYDEEYQAKDRYDFERATNRILDPALNRLPRSEPILPDAIRNPRTIRFDRLPDFVGTLHDCYPKPAEYYFPAASENDKCWDCPPHKTHR